MNVITHIVMAVWIPTVLVLFAVLPSRRAVIVSFLGAWLFLPMASYHLPVLPDYTKMTATCAGIFIATIIFDVKRVVRFKPSWADLPMVLFCAFPFASSVANGLGTYDGASAAMSQAITWAAPYFIGRIYFNDARGLRELAIAIVIGGLLYVPFCLFEVRMSPKLHSLVYGFSPRLVQVRWGGWRPSVFMDGGLEVGMWMTAASLIGIWQWKTGALKKLSGMPASILVVALLATTVLCRSTGALALLALGLAVMWLASRTNSRLALLSLLLIVPTYVGLRSTALWHGEPIVSWARAINDERSKSLKFRLDNEDILAAKAMQHPIFGWGSWGRNRVYDQWGTDLTITDGLWIIEFGLHGYAGLLSWLGIMIMPLALVIRRFPVKSLTSAELAPVLSLAVLVTLYAIDCLVNGMINPVFMLAGGAVVSFSLARARLPADLPNDRLQAGSENARRENFPPRRLYRGHA